MYENAARSYQQTNVLTADPLRLVLLCYDGAIKSLKLALASYREQQYEVKGKALQKTLDIIHELNASLDVKKGGEVANNLRSLYTFMSQALVEADLRRNLRVFEQVIDMLEELESAWKTIALAESRAGENGPRPPLYGGARPAAAPPRAWNV